MVPNPLKPHGEMAVLESEPLLLVQPAQPSSGPSSPLLAMNGESSLQRPLLSLQHALKRARHASPPPLPPPPPSPPAPPQQPPQQLGLGLLAQVARSAASPPSAPTVATGIDPAPPSQVAAAVGGEEQMPVGMGMARDVLARGIMDLATRGKLDGLKMLNFMRTLNAYVHRFGPGNDWSSGLLETVSWAEQHGKIQFPPNLHNLAVAGPGCLNHLPPEPVKDKSCMRACSACVGDSELLLYSTPAFTLAFLSPSEMRRHITASKAMCLYIWSRVVVLDDLTRFYEALVDVLLSTDTAKANLVVRCRDRHGADSRCLAQISCHRCTLPNGRPYSGYQIQLWPLGHHSLPDHLAHVGDDDVFKPATL